MTSHAQAGTTHGTRFVFEGTGYAVYNGVGSPEGVQIGSVGDFYFQAIVAVGESSLWTKTSGAATTTGWTPATVMVAVPLILTHANGSGYWATLESYANATIAPSAWACAQGVYGEARATGDFSYAVLRGVSGESHVTLAAGHTIDEVCGVSAYNDIAGGTAGKVVGVRVWANGITPPGAITYNFGLLADEQLGGTENYNIWSGPHEGLSADVAGYCRNGYPQNVFFTKNQNANRVGILSIGEDDNVNDFQALYGVSYSSHGVGTKDFHTGGGVDLYKKGAGRTAVFTGFYNYAEISGGLVDKAIGMQAEGANISGGAVVTENIALQVDGTVGGVTDYAIKSLGPAQNFFEGPLTTLVDSLSTTTQYVGATTLVNEEAAALLTIQLDAGVRLGGEVAFTVEATDVGDDNDVYTGSICFAAQRKGAVVTCAVGVMGDGIATKSHAGIAMTVAATSETSSGDSVVLQLEATSALTPTTLKAHWSLKMLKGHGLVSLGASKQRIPRTGTLALAGNAPTFDYETAMKLAGNASSLNLGLGGMTAGAGTLTGNTVAFTITEGTAAAPSSGELSLTGSPWIDRATMALTGMTPIVVIA